MVIINNIARMVNIADGVHVEGPGFQLSHRFPGVFPAGHRLAVRLLVLVHFSQYGSEEFVEFLGWKCVDLVATEPGCVGGLGVRGAGVGWVAAKCDSGNIEFVKNCTEFDN